MAEPDSEIITDNGGTAGPESRLQIGRWVDPLWCGYRSPHFLSQMNELQLNPGMATGCNYTFPLTRTFLGFK
jgi:hypothetical protein